MTAGRPPKPNELKRAQGNPGKRPLPSKTNLISLPSAPTIAPAHLGENGSRLWIDILSGNARNWIADTDKPTLQLLCEKIDRRAEIIAKLQASDFVLFTDKGYAYANPLVGMLSTIEIEITKLFTLLGLTSIDRSRLGVAEVKAASALDQLIAKRSGKN